MYKGMSGKIIKNYQINLGTPFQIKPGQIIKPVEIYDEEDAEEEVAADISENHVDKAREEADLIIREAELEAARILEAAVKEAEEKQKEIVEEAWNTGYDEGLTQGKQEYEELVREAQDMRQQAMTEYQDVIASIEADAVEVILEVARKVIGSELAHNKEVIFNLVRQAFEKSENRDKVTLRVASEDYDYVVSNKDKLFSMIEGLGELDIKRDPSLKQGACILDSAYGSIDSGVQTKLKKIEEAFREAVCE